jgi:predicted RNase H-like nuclease
MRFIGLDLAWGQNGHTGICVAEDGRILESCLVRTDDEILERLGPVAQDSCLVAIDAPLIISNATGQRACESAISRCFGKHHAGAHSSNLGMAAFSAGSRGARLCETLGLDMDPAMTPRALVRKAIEVYPHPAIVALFDLAVTLKYKAKRGRSIEDRRRAFANLVALLESLEDADPTLDVRGKAWATTREMIATSSSGAELDRIEDEIDAYVCAYIAIYYWTHGTERCRVVGSYETGYIVTPVTDAHARILDAIARKP